MANIHDALSGDYIFCCHHCEGELELIDDQPCYEVYKCESCGRNEILEKTDIEFDEGPEHEDGFDIQTFCG